MSLAWEVTTDDVQTVLDAHDIVVDEQQLEEIHDSLDMDDIEHGVLYFTDFEEQVSSMLSDIEDQLMDSEVIPKVDKKFHVSESVGEVDEFEFDLDEEEDEDD